jgi:hypothetical protein
MNVLWIRTLEGFTELGPSQKCCQALDFNFADTAKGKYALN